MRVLPHSDAYLKQKQASPDNHDQFNAFEPETINTPMAFAQKLNRWVLTGARLDC